MSRYATCVRNTNSFFAILTCSICLWYMANPPNLYSLHTPTNGSIKKLNHEYYDPTLPPAYV